MAGCGLSGCVTEPVRDSLTYKKRLKIKTKKNGINGLT